ncbi:MAG TPA: TIM-barrel domain-containing protein, partial [Trueperaceae bacterium]|nr:TIM-barrel domain-containing protein [Trueperaceae bacterium]
MIQHEPYGNEDPYKNGSCERYPRDPAPGEGVQVRFRTPVDATTARATVTTASERTTYPATSLGDGLWTVDIGAFQPGLVAYELAADGSTAVEPRTFRFEVGQWVSVLGIAGVELLEDRMRLRLATGATSTESEGPQPASTEPASGEAHLDLVFPDSGAMRAELYVGAAASAPLGDAPTGRPGSRPYSVDLADGRYVIEAAGLVAEVLLDDLSLSVRTPGSVDPAFRGSLRYRWLAMAGGAPSRIDLTFSTDADEWIYGLGERFTQANRNGEEWDVRVYEQYKEQGKRTYLPVPFIVSTNGYGLWVDAEEPSTFDLRETLAVVRVEKFVEAPGAAAEVRRTHPRPSRPSLSATVLVAPAPYQITAGFTRLTGAIAVPPKWAFGPWMSSNSWNSQALTESAVDRTLAEDVPASVVVIEAWSDESTFYIFNDAQYQPQPGSGAPHLADFTFTGRWPDPKAFVDHCHAHGIRVVLWQIPVLKYLTEHHTQHAADEQYMLESGFGIANADGSPYRNKGWWFTDSLVIDFSNPAAKQWWFGKRRYLFDELGIDGMKTDGGEHIWGRDLRAHDGRRGLALYNAYPNQYVGAYHEFVQEATSGDGVTFSRAGYTGAQRFPGHWAGDEDSTWGAYQASIRAALAAGVCGVSMWSWDIGGFSGEIPALELYLRSTAMATLSPLMQYHSEGHGASEVRDRTPWNIAARHGDASALTIYRRFAHLRMRILELIHEDAVALSAEGLPLMRYPALAYPQAHDFLSSDPYAYLFGRDLLV